MIPEITKLYWLPHHLRYGVGWKAYHDDICVYIYKIKHVRPGKFAYQFRVEQLSEHGKYRTIYDTGDDRFVIGSADFRGAKAQAEIWYQRYVVRGY